MGFRGLALFHVMIIHVFMISDSGINIYGQVIRNLPDFTHFPQYPSTNFYILDGCAHSAVMVQGLVNGRQWLDPDRVPARVCARKGSKLPISWFT